MTSPTVSLFDQKHGTFPEIQFTDTVYEDFTFGSAIRELEGVGRSIEADLAYVGRSYVLLEERLLEQREEIKARELRLTKIKLEIAALKAL